MSVILGNIPQFRWSVRNGNRFLPPGANIGLGTQHPTSSIQIGETTDAQYSTLGSTILILSRLNNPTTIENPRGPIILSGRDDIRLRINTSEILITLEKLGYVNFGLANKGLICGQFGQENIPTTVAIGTVSTDYVVDGMTNLIDNRLIFQNNREYKVETKGFYVCIWGLSIEVAAGAKEIEGAVGLNGVKQPLSSGHRTIANPNDSGHIGGVGLVDCAVNDLLSIVVRNNTDTQNIIVNHANFYVQQVLGT